MYRFPYPWVEELDAESLPNCTVYQTDGHGSAAARSLEAAVRDSLENPIGCPSLAAMLRDSSAKKVLILVDDMTRPTPQRRMLPALLSALEESGIRSEDICIV
ncbi:MAG: lactate racemase domain-containing protein, partial [Rectinemataceae bacterium]|nr:lactate racemase domain-containing protein [Rectinemataceae bacterium]